MATDIDQIRKLLKSRDVDVTGTKTELEKLDEIECLLKKLNPQGSSTYPSAVWFINEDYK